MKHRAQGRQAGPTESGRCGSGLLRSAGAFSAPCGDGTGAPIGCRTRTLLAALSVLALLAALTAAPALASEATTPILSEGSYSSVHVEAEADVGGFGYYYVEYSTDQVNWVVGYQEFGFEPGPIAFETNLTGLKGATTYFLRTRAEALGVDEATSPEPNPQFTTLPVDPPSVISIEDASEVLYNVAAVKGRVSRPPNPANPPLDPNAAFNVDCNFEYVTDDQFKATDFQAADKAPCRPSNPVSTPGPSDVTAKLVGLATDTTYHLRLSATNAGGGESKVAANTFTTLAGPPPAPSVQIDPVSAFSDHGAHLSGTVDTHGATASWHFRCVPACGEPGGSLDGGFSPDALDADISGLEPDSTYLVELIASGEGGEDEASLTFKTALLPPSVHAAFAEDVEADAATVLGEINPHNSEVTYRFEYGTDESYGSLAPPQAASLGEIDNAYHGVSQPLADLQPGTTYHFRLSATNTESGQTTHGEDRTFATGPAAPCPNQQLRAENSSLGLPDCRAYELVSPVNKSGNDAGAPGNSVLPGYSTADGDAVLYGSRGPIGNALRGLQEYSTSRRSVDGWTTGPAIPAGSADPFFVLPHLPRGLIPSSDLSSSIFNAGGTYVPDNPDTLGEAHSGAIYVGHEDGTIEWVTRPRIPDPVPAPGHYDSYTVFQTVGASPDLSTVYFWAAPTLLPEDSVRASSGLGGKGLYEYTGGELRPAGTLPEDEVGVSPADLGQSPGGAAPASTEGTSSINENHTSPDIASNQVSRDGSTLWFVSPDPGPDPGIGPSTQLYVRRDGQPTLVSHTPDGAPAPAGVSPAFWLTYASSDTKAHQFAYASPDAGSAIFQSRSALTSAAPTDASVKTYRYITATDTLTYLPDVSETVVASSDDGSRFLFGGEKAGIGLWDNGIVKTIYSGNALQLRPARATASGSVFVFSTKAAIPGFNSGGVLQIYRYDVAADQLSCLSCPPDSITPTAGASLAGLDPGASTGELIASRAISTDAKRVFFQSPDALVAADTDGVQDVYEWTPGGVFLVSSGKSTLGSFLLDNSADGDDVFFATTEGLDPRDTDGSYDVYDARVDGGFAQVASTAPCTENQTCKDAGPDAPTQPGPATNSPPTAKTPRFKVGAAKLSGGALKLRITAPEAATVSASAKGTKGAGHTFSAAGSARLGLPLTPASKRTLHRKHRLKLEVHLRFAPRSGAPSSANVVLTVKG